jgi:hypothetical protein
MKCVKFANGDLKRVSDFEAERLVESGRAMYIPRQLWKQLAGGSGKVVATIAGVVEKSHVEGNTRVISQFKLHSVSLDKPKLKAKDRRKAERKRK